MINFSIISFSMFSKYLNRLFLYIDSSLVPDKLAWPARAYVTTPAPLMIGQPLTPAQGAVAPTATVSSNHHEKASAAQCTCAHRSG